jgi:hypothetical protein
MRRSGVIGLAFAAAVLASAFAGLAYGSPAKEPPAGKQLNRACSDTIASIRAVVNEAASKQARSIQSHLVVVTPGELTGTIAFNRSGKSITVTADRGGPSRSTVSHSNFACGQGRAGHPGLGPGQSRVVSTLQETFTAPGRYTLTFELNQTGRTILAQLGAAERAYRKHNPHGHQPPTLAYGVDLSYSTSG